MAKEAAVPFLFVSSSAFQSMYYGQTNRKIRTYFKSLRKAARKEGGAIGFIEEIDAVGASRSGMKGGRSEGITGVVNELLIQLQSFDTPPARVRVRNSFIELANTFLPSTRQIRKRMTVPANILVIGATNRASDLDPALLRPGRFDELIYVGVPDTAGRRRILAIHTEGMPLADDVDLESVAQRTERFTGADLEDLVRRAGLTALRRGLDAVTVTKADFDVALGESRASVTPEMLEEYDRIQDTLKSEATRPLGGIGFVLPGMLRPKEGGKP
jgi:transitional endoplasmic reticulum ATPase